MPKRFKQALKAGTVGYTLTVLALALFVSPILGTHIDFGHTHPQNTASHTHAISDFFSSDTPKGIPLVIFALVIVATLFHRQTLQKCWLTGSTQKSRAPPVFISLF